MDPMKVLVLSHDHNLLPLAWRLKREGHDVSVLVVRKRYHKAWAGKLYKEEVASAEKRISHITAEQWGPWADRAREEGTIVITDEGDATKDFSGAPGLFPTLKDSTYGHPGLVLGAWFDGGTWYHPHWFLPDWGAWPGGLGAGVIAGGTVARRDPWPAPLSWLEELTEPLATINYRGLVGVGLAFIQATREFQPTGFQAGWTPIHWQLFLEGIRDWGALFDGRPAEAQPIPDTYSVGIAVSQPPWPSLSDDKPQEVELVGVTPEVTSSCFFHDIQMKGQSLWTGGTDGLVGIARGSGRVFSRAKGRALLVAGALRFPERQLRTDVGNSAEAALAVLEELGYW